MKYRLTEETKELVGRTLYRIEALKDFADVQAGDKGGWIEKESNLSQQGNAWVCGNAKVFDDAMVCGDAWVYGNAKVYDNAEISGEAEIYDNAEVCGNADVYGNAIIYGDANVSTIKDYIVFKNWWSSGRYFTWTRSNNMWKVGCFYGTGEELIKKAYADSKESGKEYERVVKYVEEILKEHDKS